MKATPASATSGLGPLPNQRDRNERALGASPTVPLLRSLGRLTADEREAWVDFTLVGKTCAEIGLARGVSRERVRQQVERARVRLAGWLTREDMAA